VNPRKRQPYSPAAMPVTVTSMAVGDGSQQLPIVQLAHPSGATCEVTPYGAHVYSWKMPDGQEQLYLTSKWPGCFNPAKGIRGGIPVCWPQFSETGPMATHGFLRRSQAWQITESGDKEDGTPFVTFRITDSEESRGAVGWAEMTFAVTVTVMVEADKLRHVMGVENTSEKEMVFTGALHTYFAVEDVLQARVSGLSGQTYLDKLQDFKPVVDSEASISFNGEKMDRSYCKTGPVAIEEPSGRKLVIEKEGWGDIVVWNIGEKDEGSMADMGTGEWQRYVCVEGGVIRPESPIVLPAGQAWTGIQVFTCSKS